MAAYRIVFLLIVLIVSLSHGSVDATVPDRFMDLNFRFSPVRCPAPDMPLKDLNGRVFTLGSLGGRVVILNFWKIDCPPCSKEKPILERISRKYGGRGLEVLAVNLVDSGDQQQAYVRNSRFGFRFALAPDNRLFLRQLATGPGVSTSFVVNSKQDALYEVPAVPTTYLIDRNGCLVGDCVGLADWEQPTMTQLLESLLGPATRMVTTVAESREEGEGSRPISFAAAVNSGSAKNGSTQSYGLIAQSMDSTRLPFQGGAKTGTSESAMPSAPQSSLEIPSGTTSKPAPATSRPAAKPKAAAKKRPDAKPSPASGVDYRQPRPYSAPSVGLAKPALGPNRASAPRTPAKPQALTQPPIPPTTSGSPAQLEPGFNPSGSSTLQPLPPAMPYNPRATSPAQPPVVPDQEGSVLARVPSSGRTAPVAGQGRQDQAGGANLPPAQPLSQRNAISGFVQDSFGRSSAPAAPQTAPEGSPQAPANSLWGQLGQDFQQLGSGIRDVFSRLTPSR